MSILPGYPFPAVKSYGFSMLELMVVLVIAGLLLGFVGPAFIGRLELAQESYAVDQFRGELAQLPRWARITGQRLEYKKLEQPVLIDGVEVLALPQGWQVEFDPPWILLPNLVCSASSVRLSNAAGVELKRLDISSPDCLVLEK